MTTVPRPRDSNSRTKNPWPLAIIGANFKLNAPPHPLQPLRRAARRPGRRARASAGLALRAQHVIVPSRAVQRAIELALADRIGICANVEFSFLAQWLWRQIARLVPVADSSPFAPPVLAWRIFEILGDQRFVTDHPRLARYLRDADALMRYELAQRVASLFDQYITYRPDWLARWVEGQPVPELAQTAGAVDDDQRWQAALWRRIAADIGTTRRHPSTAFFDAIAVRRSRAAAQRRHPGQRPRLRAAHDPAALPRHAPPARSLRGPARCRC